LTIALKERAPSGLAHALSPRLMTINLPLGAIYGFLLVLARVSGLVVFLPVPGFRAAPGGIRIVLGLAMTLALFPVWPVLANTVPSVGQLTGWAFAEAGFGLSAGLAVAFLTEGFQVAAQVLGLQAGYGYATTIDPNSQADSGVLQVVTMLITGLLFFTLGIDRELIRILAASFKAFPAGSWTPTAVGADSIVRLGSAMFTIGLRLAMPVIALLLLIDLALALVGRMQQQLQLLSLAFPAKMLAALAILTALAPVTARFFENSAHRTVEALWRGLTP
jgi:flagellar biosynthetic protein FliR